MKNLKGMKGSMLCPTKREHNFNVVNGNSTDFIKYDKMREVINGFKLIPRKFRTLEEVDKFLFDFFDKEYVGLSKVEAERAYKDSREKVLRYLEHDGRTCAEQRYFKFTFAGEEFSYRPNFCYRTTTTVVLKEGVVGIPTCEVVSFSASKQKISWKAGSSIDSSISCVMETLGMLMYGLEQMKQEKGLYAIKVSYHALASEDDKKFREQNGYMQGITENEVSKSHISSITYVFRDTSWLFTIRGKHTYERNVAKQTNKSPFVALRNSLEKINSSSKCSQAACKECYLHEICTYAYAPVPKTEEVFTKSLDDFSLTNEQESITTADKGIFRVLATAGAGKTLCVVYRLMNLLLQGYNAKKMLLISFSNIAVEELQSRIASFLVLFGLDDMISASDIKVSTFNALGMQLILNNYEVLGFTEKPTLIDDIEKTDILAEILKDSDIVLKEFDYDNPLYKIGNRAIGVIPKLMKEFETIKSEDIRTFAEYDKFNGLTKAIQNATEVCFKIDAENNYEEALKIWNLYEEYRTIMKSRNLVDFSDQSSLVKDLMMLGMEEGRDYITETYHYEHIIVDEFQDSDEFQLAFIKSLISSISFSSLMVVGDDSQAIYGFRHTSPENIIKFDKLIGVKVTDLPLYETHRFGSNIAEIANAIIDLNISKLEKSIVSYKPASENIPKLVGFDSKKDELNYIADEIEKLINDGVAPEDIAFLSTKNDTLASLQQVLSEKNIPALKNAEKFLDNSKVLAVINLASYINSFEDTKGLMVYLNDVYQNKFLDMSKQEVNELIALNKEDFEPVFLSMDLDEKKSYFLSLINLVNTGNDHTFNEFYKKIMDKAENYSVYELVSYILKFRRYQAEDEVKRNGIFPAVTLATIWRAKGGEWKHVFASCSDMAKARSMTLSDIEESRRLLFTMVTRMKESLTITSQKLVAQLSNAEVEVPNMFYEELKYLGSTGANKELTKFFECIEFDKPNKVAKAS